MNGNLFILFPVFIPIILGAVFPFLKFLKSRKQKMIYVGISLCSSALLSVVALLTVKEGSDTLLIWNLTEKLPVYMKIDQVSKLFAYLTTAVWVIVGFYSFGYMKQEEEEERYFSFYLIVYGVLMGLDFSGNLISLYIFYELMTLTSLPLVLHNRTKEAVLAGLKYLFYSVAGAFMALLGIFFVYQYGTTMEFTAGGVLNVAKLSGHEGLFLTVTFLTILGFGCKAGMFPLHAWLPTAHPVAPSPASAVLSGIITKAGVLAIIRMVFFIVGADFLRGTWVQTAWMSISLFTVFMGSMMAYKEPLLKKRLAYSTVSQVSYILFGLSLLNTTGALGALLHVVFHSLIKNTLFLAAGAVIMQTGCKRVDELTGIGKRMPVTIWCFTLTGLALVGIPPLSGFISKWYLASGALSSNIAVFEWLGPVILLISALLTAGYLLPVTVKGFLPGHSETLYERCEAPKIMTVPMLLLTAGAVLFGIFAAPLCDAVREIVLSFVMY